MKTNEIKCCTPNGQIKRYKDCIGCDRNPLELNQNKMTAVEYLQKQLFERFVWSDTILFLELIYKAKEMEEEQNNAKIQKAIELFEEAKIQADIAKDVIYLDGVLAVLDGIKNTKL